MPCYFPLNGWKSKVKNDSGKRSIVFNRKDAYVDMPVQVPCGQCIGCRLLKAKQWAIRCMHEASLYNHNCFITLTYNDQNLPENNSLNNRDIQLFIKRLRKKYGNKIRYFQCGEYGDKLNRPHHHAIIFNHDFHDKQPWSHKNKITLYRSEQLEKLWKKGFSTIGEVTYDSACYVARYITKKITGEKALPYYNGKKPEYTTMSRRPGIGKPWLDKYKDDVYPHDYVIINNFKAKPPKYYDSKYDLTNPISFIKIKHMRKEKQKNNINNCADRLDTREKYDTIMHKQLPRRYEDGTKNVLSTR